MDRTIRVTLTKEEYVEYMVWQISNSKRMRGTRWFMLTSVPAILITGVLVLKIRNRLFISSIFALAVIWIMYGAKALWKHYITGKIEKKAFPQMNIRKFREISYHFESNGITYQDGKKPMFVDYRNLVLMPLENQFAFCSKNGTILIPYRTLGGDEELRGFVEEYELSRKNRK